MEGKKEGIGRGGCMRQRETEKANLISDICTIQVFGEQKVKMCSI